MINHLKNMNIKYPIYRKPVNPPLYPFSSSRSVLHMPIRVILTRASPMEGEGRGMSFKRCPPSGNDTSTI